MHSGGLLNAPHPPFLVLQAQTPFKHTTDEGWRHNLSLIAGSMKLRGKSGAARPKNAAAATRNKGGLDMEQWNIRPDVHTVQIYPGCTDRDLPHLRVPDTCLHKLLRTDYYCIHTMRTNPCTIAHAFARARVQNRAQGECTNLFATVHKIVRIQLVDTCPARI